MLTILIGILSTENNRRCGNNRQLIAHNSSRLFSERIRLLEIRTLRPLLIRGGFICLTLVAYIPLASGLIKVIFQVLIGVKQFNAIVTNIETIQNEIFHDFFQVGIACVEF
jgi:hypothetical protein